MLSFGDVHLMDIPHVVDHLVSTSEALLSLPMAARKVAIDKWKSLAVVNYAHVSLQVRGP